MSRYLIIFSLFLTFIFNQTVIGAPLKDFDHWFNDSTLRIDYIFGGDENGAYIFLESQTKQKGWAGRRAHLKETPLKGNGNIIVLDPETGDTIYNNSFSTLFQEWLATENLPIKNQSFENSFLVPLPKKAADITLSLRDNKLYS